LTPFFSIIFQFGSIDYNGSWAIGLEMFSNGKLMSGEEFLRHFRGGAPLLAKFNGEVAILGRNFSSPTEFLGEVRHPFEELGRA